MGLDSSEMYEGECDVPEPQANVCDMSIYEENAGSFVSPSTPSFSTISG